MTIQPSVLEIAWTAHLYPLSELSCAQLLVPIAPSLCDFTRHQTFLTIKCRRSFVNHRARHKSLRHHP